MAEGLDLHLGVDQAAGFVERALETALREAIRSGRLRARRGPARRADPRYATPPPHAWSRALDALVEVGAGVLPGRGGGGARGC